MDTELRNFSHFQILTKIAYPDLSRKLENWLFLEFFFIHCKTVKVSQNDQIQNPNLIYKWFLDERYRIKKVLVIFKFWPESDIRTLAEILKID